MNRKMKGNELVDYIHRVKPLVASVPAANGGQFNVYANVFNTAKQAMTFVAKHRPGHIVVKVGRKYVPATPEFAKRMGLKIITNNG